jgi:hypothetical protein
MLYKVFVRLILFRACHSQIFIELVLFVVGVHRRPNIKHGVAPFADVETFRADGDGRFECAVLHLYLCRQLFFLSFLCLHCLCLLIQTSRDGLRLFWVDLDLLFSRAYIFAVFQPEWL